MQHAELDGIHTNVFHNGLDLRFQKSRWYAVNARHPQRVLRSERGDRCHAVAAQRGKSFEVGLDARAAATVGACDGEHPRITLGGQRGCGLGKGTGVRCHAENYDPQ